jgi:hypothetical protein
MLWHLQEAKQKSRELDFKEFLLSGPDLRLLDLERSRELPRDIEL